MNQMNQLSTEFFTSLLLDPEKKAQKRQHFFTHSLVDLSDFFSSEIKADLLNNLEHLFSLNEVRRDFTMEATDHTPRRMTNVESRFLQQNKRITDLYNDPRLTSLLCDIVGEQVYPCPYEPEKIVATKLHKKGDTHGWHWDDYSFAIIFVLKAPPPSAGGILQCVPHTNWDRNFPDIVSWFLIDNIRSYYFPSGSVYLMQTKTTLHRVYPLLQEDEERIILNFAFATKNDFSDEINHETVNELWNPED